MAEDAGGGGGWSYPADMQHISFPTGAATEAKTVCNRIASMLDGHLQNRPGMVSDARDGWEGAYREEFDETWRTQETRLVGLKEDLQTLASRIETAMGNVGTENERREGLREEYREEQSETAGAN
jgi:hypothetical protein